MKAEASNFLALAATLLVLATTSSSAQVNTTKPVGVTAITDADPGDFTTLTADTVASALIERARTNNINLTDGVFMLTPLVRDLLAAEPEPIAAPKTDVEFFSTCSGIAQELILELIRVRETGTSNYLSRSTLRQVRKPAVNDALLKLLVRATR